MFDKRIDDYINKSVEFARPILKHLRELVHQANPEVSETVKWGMPAFDYKGPLCSMASFKQHCVFGFWKSKLLHDPEGYLHARSNEGGEAMGNLGRITGMADIPPDTVLIDFIRQASKLNDEGVKLPVESKKGSTELNVPGYILESLSKKKEAMKVFEKFNTSHKREYVEWITGAKTEETRRKRLETAITWISEGKTRNWKYIRK